MRKTLLALAAALLASPTVADTLVTNVNGVQVDARGQLQHFTGLLIGNDGKVVRTLGPADDAGVKGMVVDGGGRTLLPGLIDAHGHVLDLGMTQMTVQLVGTSSLADLQKRLRDYAASHPRDAWIIGFGWNQELWPDKRFPTAADLDAVVSDRPVVLERVDGHAVVANSAAMKAAGVTAQTAAPPGGRIENGLFVDAARGLIDNGIPKRTPVQSDEALAKAQEQLLSVGVTGVGSMSTSVADWEAMKRAGAAGTLKIRLMAYLSGTESLAAVPSPTPWMYGDRLRAVGIKLFADGALGSRGAWLKQPYADKPDTGGLQFHSGAGMLSLADTAAAAGVPGARPAIRRPAAAQKIRRYENVSGI